MNAQTSGSENDVVGEEHWTQKGDARLFLWEKFIDRPSDDVGTLVFVHGSSMASQPTFDLHVEGRPFSSAMNWFAVQGLIFGFTYLKRSDDTAYITAVNPFGGYGVAH